jgi:hypothetical protein
MLELLAIVALSIAAFLLVNRVFRRRGSSSKPDREAAIEVWARAEIARIVAQKLDLEEQDVSATMAGAPDPDVVTRLERGIRKVEIVYERVPGMPNAADVRVEVMLENGKLERSIRRIEQSELPAHVADELASTGAAQVFRPFVFPWQSA